MPFSIFSAEGRDTGLVSTDKFVLAANFAKFTVFGLSSGRVIGRTDVFCIALLIFIEY